MALIVALFLFVPIPIAVVFAGVIIIILDSGNDRKMKGVYGIADDVCGVNFFHGTEIISLQFK